MFGASVKKCDYKEELDRVNAKFETSEGDFEIELFAKECPETVWNFINLAEGRQEGAPKPGPYFDGLIFHRIISGFMIQGGCPDGLGTGGPGYKFDNEQSPELTHSDKGIMAMANAGRDTNGSQFYITLNPQPSLDGGYTVFGKVVSGIEVVEKIGQVPTGFQDRPEDEVTMNKVTIIRPS